MDMAFDLFPENKEKLTMRGRQIPEFFGNKHGQLHSLGKKDWTEGLVDFLGP